MPYIQGWLKMGSGEQFIAEYSQLVRRGYGLGETGPSPSDLRHNSFGLSVPDKGLGVIVPVLCRDLDAFNQVRDRREDEGRDAARSGRGTALDEVRLRDPRGVVGVAFGQATPSLRSFSRDREFGSALVWLERP